jgi:hypothetical protein
MPAYNSVSLFYLSRGFRGFSDRAIHSITKFGLSELSEIIQEFEFKWFMFLKRFW